MSTEVDADVAIIGSGIAGYSAAIYTSRADNKTLIFKGDEPGGQLTLTTDVANYPGFPEGVGGSELVSNIEEQAENFGAETINGIVKTVEKKPSYFEIKLTNNETYTVKSVISASGASARTLGIPGEDELMGFGVSTCATCDGAFFRGEDMAVVGGGDAAVEEAIFLTKFADTVYLIHRREDLRAEEYLQEKLQNKIESNEIEFMKNTEVTSVSGEQETGIESVSIVSHPEGHPKEKYQSEEENSVQKYDLDVEALFVAIGHTPNTDYLTQLDDSLTDDHGYLEIANNETSKRQTETTVEGLFGAGDVTDSRYQQAATAAGLGVKAAIDANEYLDEVKA